VDSEPRARPGKLISLCSEICAKMLWLGCGEQGWLGRPEESSKPGEAGTRPGSPELPHSGLRAGFWLLAPGSWLLASCSWLLVPRSWFLAAGSWLLVPGSRSWLLGAGSWLLVPGSWLLASGSWLMALASWLLAPGSWLLALGSWLLAPGSHRPDSLGWRSPGGTGSPGVPEAKGWELRFGY